jgi:ketosteroid isomerase-like protein
MTASNKSDAEQILSHIRSIFQAYLDKDRETIRRTHTDDWVGFQGPSTKIERGIEAYMVNAEKSLAQIDGTGFELLDTEVQIFDDLAIVYYVARYDYRDGQGHDGSVPLRSVDVYRRQSGEWIQIGSHIGTIPESGEWVSERTDSID